MSGTRVLTSLKMDGRDLLVHNYQDVEDIREHNLMLQGEPQKSDWGRHVASVPNNIINQWLNEEAARGNVMRIFSEEFNRMYERKIRDPENAAWRTDNPSNPFYVGWRK